ncbi:unnamed protein product [Rhizoctonia solani]|uniref:Uncharacterized protein n=1 Tax=Rhizoctonia solani TaxID=456999 RepID=A0A8H3CUH9_9AGAM|nr:uncharacterized protein RhiXN_09232 [Rhizoctonia solani]KAF8685691.1 hypothetical protein RHS04_00613 [Rhizoctonia solani]QRW20257.1 hypothetical protein RhiXN_09232 [Rhizoctonia solani]CAE6491663.1 unnamed protein product [Rhizoctonia solani]
MSTPFTSLSRASTIHSEDRGEGTSFAFETPTPASRPASRPSSRIDLANGEVRTVSDFEKRALAPSLRTRKAGQPMIGQFDRNLSPISVASTLAASEPPNPMPVVPVVGKQKIVIRSDPALLTCFDPKDKELYDLWAPKV